MSAAAEGLRWRDGALLRLECVDSTNIYLRRGEFADKTAVLADSQSAGRGRLGRGWADAGPAGLYLSVLFQHMKPALAGFLPLICGLAAAEALGEEVGLKWPNDLVCRGKKLGGILCESFPMGEALSVVCGFGVNLGQRADFFEAVGLPYATSLRLCTGHAPDRVWLARRILEGLADRIRLASEESFASMLPEYARRSVTLGREVLLVRDGIAQAGVALSLDDAGNLVVRLGAEIVTVRSGEVSVRGMYGYV